jgi:ADP-ribosylglycohydrolase
VNAADPLAAYAEAIDLTGAHQSSYGREAAGVMAACVATAMAPGATVDDVISTALKVARDGTRQAIAAILAAAESYDHWTSAVDSGALRAAVAPFDTVGEDYRDQGLGARRPSRLHSIEELPVALGLLLLAKGDWTDAVLGGVNYGRDSDSIATMAGALAGALGGRAAVPEQLAEDVSTASQVDIVTPGERLAEVTLEIRLADAERQARTAAAFDRLADP